MLNVFTTKRRNDGLAATFTYIEAAGLPSYFSALLLTQWLSAYRHILELF
jgi:hypothetical protein